MAGDLGDLPGIELAVDLLGQRRALLAQAADLFGDVQRRVALYLGEFLDLGFEFGDRLFEVEKSDFHGVLSLNKRAAILLSRNTPGRPKRFLPPSGGWTPVLGVLGVHIATRLTGDQ